MNRQQQHEENERRKRERQMEHLRAMAQRPDASRADQGQYLNAQNTATNEPALRKQKEKEAQEAAEEERLKNYPGGEFRGAFKEDIMPVVKVAAGDVSALQNFGADQSGVHSYAEDQADRGNAPKRNDGFINLYSRNFRRVMGDDGEQPEAQEWWLATGQLSPYIDAKADEELQDGGEPGFWNMYSGLHNLVGKTILQGYGVYGG